MDRLKAAELLAKAKGWLAPEKQEHTVKDDSLTRLLAGIAEDGAKKYRRDCDN